MIDKACFVSQQEIAERFQVNRTTIRAWTKQGMPYLNADRGKSGGYHIGHTLLWSSGKSHFRPSDITSEPVRWKKLWFQLLRLDVTVLQ
ncbi:hypothetical protein ACLB1Q_33190 [Escherichia coli]